MKFNCQPQVDQKGLALARWINRELALQPSDRRASIIGAFVLIHAGYIKFSPGNLLLFGGKLHDRVPEEFSVSFTGSIVFRLGNGTATCDLQGMDEAEAHLLTWFELIRSGQERFLRWCPGCRQFYFRAGRSDRKFCSSLCRVLWWQKTPQGRATKAAGMRKIRARQKEGEPKGERLRGAKQTLRGLGR